MAYIRRPRLRARSLPRVDEGDIEASSDPDLLDYAGDHGGFDDVVAAVSLPANWYRLFT